MSFFRLNKFSFKGVFPLIFLFSFLFLLNLKAEAADWYHPDWSYRKKITVNETSIPGTTDLTNFPVLVKITSDSNLKDYAQASGNDILFTSSNGTTKLSHEIESYSNITGQLTAWVKVPTLLATTNTDIYMYYGNGNVGSQTDGQNVWSSYSSVWHLGNNVIDSKTWASPTNNDTVTNPGLIGNSRYFSCYSPYTYISMANKINSSVGTESMWVNILEFPWDTSSAPTLLQSEGYYFALNSSQKPNSYIEYYSSSGWQTANTSAVGLNNWYFLSIVRNNSNTKLYVNGVLAKDVNIATGNPGSTMYLGNRQDGIGRNYYKVCGNIDEFRTNTLAVSTEWTQTEYNNQSNPSTFYSLNTQEGLISGYSTTNIPSGLAAVLGSDWVTDVSTNLQLDIKVIGIKNTSHRIAELGANFTQNIDFTGVTADSSVNKAFFHAPSTISTLTNNQSSSYTLYIPKGDGDKVWICPGASSLTGVSLSCSGGYFLSLSNPTANGATATVSTEGPTGSEVTYWKVSGLTGTGGMSVVTGLKDTLSRLQASTGSDHTITFGTNNGLTASGHSMVVTFDPSNHSFDLSTLTISDIALTDNTGTPKTLAATPGVDTWGVEINTTEDTITFTAPTSGTTGYIPAASMMTIKIGTNVTGGTSQILNPSTTGKVQETITITNADTEGGIVAIPIVDSDQVDVTGYINAFINFDIDTNTDNGDCASDACLDYEYGNPTSNYTVDLGELSSSIVNKSGVRVVHSTSNNITRKINNIYFDIETNAIGGAVVTVKSLNSGLKGPGTDIITSVENGDVIDANSGKYGLSFPEIGTARYGSIVLNLNCSDALHYCGPTSTELPIFTTNNLPLDSGRVKMDLAAAASFTNNPGTYTDTLTFVATAIF